MATFWIDFANLSFNILSIQNTILFVLFLTVTWHIFSLLLRQRSNAPGPKGYPLIGNMLEMRPGEIVSILTKWEKTYGPIIQFRPKGIFGPDYFAIGDAEAFKQILVTNSKKYKKIPVPEITFDENLIWSNGKEHTRQRKMIHPIFKVSNLKGMMGVFTNKVQLLSKVWTDIIENGKQEESCLCVQDDLNQLSLDIIGECVFGYRFNSITTGRNDVTTAFREMATVVTASSWNISPLNFSFKKENNYQQIITETILQIVREKRNKQAAPNNIKDLLDLLMEVFDDETGERMGEKQLHSQIFIFMFAGHETSNLAMTWALYFLAQHPEIQEKLREEINETIQDETTEWETYDSMPYLNAVINESLRISPPAAIFRRKVIKDDNILGYKIPAGSMLLLSPYLIHHRSDYWDDPETFNPDRFLNKGQDDNPSHNYTFLPFSKGPRTCIGNKFALMEMKVVLSTLLQNFSFSMPQDGRHFRSVLKLTYRPEPPLELIVRKL